MLVAMGDNAVKCQLFDMLPQLHCPLLLSIPPYRHTAILPQNAVAHKVAMWRTWRGAVACVALLCGACGVALCGHERGAVHMNAASVDTKVA
jgi:hypothetical protein